MTGTAIFVLNETAMATARAVQRCVDSGLVYGLTSRTRTADRTFTHFSDALQSCYREGNAIVGVCAVGIVVRALAPVLTDKRVEPPVIAISDDGSHVVPLLGGLTGANELARQIADCLGGTAVITASGSRRFGVQLEAPPVGYVLANPEVAKPVTAELIAGASVRLEGQAKWLTESGLPFDDDGSVTIRVTTDAVMDQATSLIFHPRAIVVACPEGAPPSFSTIEEKMQAEGMAMDALAAVLCPRDKSAASEFGQAVRERGAAVRYCDGGELTTNGFGGAVSVVERGDLIIAVYSEPADVARFGRAGGRLTVVGLGPGAPGYLNSDVRRALSEADDLVGYQTYLDLVPVGRPDQRRHASGNRVEIERSCDALDLAAEGRCVAVVSSGDPGIFAMAGAVLEAYEAEPERWPGVEIVVLPGVSAMQTLAARVGAPLGHDFCAISLSDIRKPWPVIERRLRAAAEADFVIAIYNPASKTRRDQIAKTKDVLLQTRSAETTVIVGRNLARDGESVDIVTLGALDPETIDMRTILIVGSSRTRVFDGPGGVRMAYSPRTYDD